MQNRAKPISGLHLEQRKFFRYPVDGEAMLCLGEAGGMVRCRMIDLGMNGCRLRREADLTAAIGMKVEVSFQLSGIAFRLAGELAWRAKDRTAGVRFEPLQEDQRKELERLLSSFRREMAERAGEPPMPWDSGAERSEAKKPPSSPEPVAISKDERRAARRHKVDSYARLNLLSLHVKLRGKIQDVSLSGCRMVLDAARSVGAYRRIEIEFFIDGLPLLLPGVTQVMHDKRTVGIRFVEMTERKRAQLHTVIEEIEQRMNTAGNSDASA